MRNLSELAIKNRTLVWYFIIVIAIAGVFSYMKLGRMEDPAYTVRQMVVTAAWPGATARQMEEQVTDKIEKKLQDTPNLDYLKSYSRPGQTVIYVYLTDQAPRDSIRDTWHEVRNLTEDMKSELPDGVVGPFFNDRFDDVYGSVYAVTGDDYSYEELRQKAEEIRRIMLTVDDVSKVELVGEQSEAVYIEIANDKLAELGIPPTAISDAVSGQNAMTPAGMVDTESDNVYLRVSGVFDDLESIRNLPINANGRLFRLGDIASVERRYTEPADPKMFFDGKPAVGIALSMKNGGNILELGSNLEEMQQYVKQNLPAGMELHQVSDQPKVVEESIDDFVDTLREAILIVLAVSFLSLGLRTGLVVACCIPLVLTGVFCVMEVAGIDLHKVSLGALIISLGLLVDDAIIAVEMMSVQLERGMNRLDAACHAFKVTAKPMLTGTLVTCAGFIPVAFSDGAASEFCQALFPVILSALVLSWLVSVMAAPLFGYYLIRVKAVKTEETLYQNRFYDGFRAVLVWCLSHRRAVIGGTAALCIASAGLMKYIPQEFFPPSLRPEIIVEMTLPEGSSLAATEKEAAALARYLDTKPGQIKNYSYYVGEGAPRFVLTLEPVLPADNYAQFVVVAADVEGREALAEDIRREIEERQPGVRCNIKSIPLGPPSDYPIMLRVSGYDIDKVKAYAAQAADAVRQDPNVRQVFLNWEQKSEIVQVRLDQEKLRAMGASGQTIAQTLYTELSGATIAEYYGAPDKTIAIQLRLSPDGRNDLSRIRSLPVYAGTAGYVPLEQVATISYGAEEGLIWRRDLKPTITVEGTIRSGTANDATQKAYDDTAAIRSSLPFGYSIEVDGDLENSQKSLGYLLKPVPVMVLLIMTLLMIQLRSVSLMALTLITAPMGVVGVAIAMLLLGKSLGFVAYLGILALGGMIIRNSVILIDQIKQHLAAGEDPWHAVIDSAVLRFRPIMLTAAAAILGMVPLMTSIFWGPMAVAIAGGLLGATVLTLLVLPTMYAAWFRIYPE
ncbi:efflux RND transporter permease subunit [uncultured Megasphaera sp.]|uniref:efflux RND transporter permease subunit n=1 Tax=uncultured Megasphaera sp. TaxID=165188 RepID=UPI002594B727|nr:efflux RND transporter permease subunit [uncultured Megasphaera sp.]